MRLRSSPGQARPRRRAVSAPRRPRCCAATRNTPCISKSGNAAGEPGSSRGLTLSGGRCTRIEGRVATFDSVLIISFGGPQGLDDIRPFLANVLRGRRIGADRVEEVARHYELFGGVSPLTAITLRQAEALGVRLEARGYALPVYVGMRNWHPYLADTMRAMYDAGARDAGMTDWALVYQSRSGRPDDPWLEPDVSEYLRRERAAGLEAAVLCPIGFVCDHIEVLYDLDREAAHVAADAGLPMVRAAAVNDDPLFIDMMADVVIDTVERYRGRPLPLADKGSRQP